MCCSLLNALLLDVGDDDEFVDWISRPDDEVLYRRGIWHMVLLRSYSCLPAGRPDQTAFTVRSEQSTFSVRL